MYNPWGMTAEEIGDKGKAVYRERLQAQLDTPENQGKVLSIDIKSGDYVLGDHHFHTSGGLKAKRPDAIIYTMRIGFPAVIKAGWRLSSRFTEKKA